MTQSVRQWLRGTPWRRLGSWLLGVALLAVVAFYVMRTLLVDTHAPVRLVVYAFSTQEQVFTEGIFPAFEQAWEARTGRDLTIEAMFGASGTLAGQINLGAPADVAILSDAEHVDWLKLGRRVRRDAAPVTIGCTPMVIVARSGNPLHLAGYADLARPGLRVLHADPRRSGAGEWGLMAEYASAYLPSGDKAAGELLLKDIWRNVRLLAPSARAAMSLFEVGAGDALVTYEQDAVLALRRGVGLEVVIPTRTIGAQPVAVIVDENVTRLEKPVAEEFVAFLVSEAGQEIFGRYYLRPPHCLGDAFPAPAQPIFTIADLGGWSQAYAEVVDGVWKQEIEPGLSLEETPERSSTGEP